MSKTLSFRGMIAPGLQEKINLATLNGKTGYKIKKFQLMSKTPGADADVAFIAQIFASDQTGSITATVNFTNSNLLAAAFYNAEQNAGRQYETIIFDDRVFNQDIYINITDADGGTKHCNYYIELETMPLTDIQSTQLTLKNLRTIAST